VAVRGRIPHGGTSVTTDTRYVVIKVECSHCKTKQKVHVAVRTGPTQMGNQMVHCIQCNNYFEVYVIDKIVRGPFPV
jgi:hypothetical protein